MSAEITRLPRQNGLSFILFVIAAIAIGFVPIVSLIAAYGLLVVPFALILALVFFKKPVWALFAFILILPIHSLALTILLTPLSMPALIVRAVAAWKEALLIGIFVVAVVQLMMERRPFRITWVDWLAVLWLGQIVIYFLFHEVFFDWRPDLTTKLYGARDWLLYLLPFFIGRMVLVSEERASRVVKAILFIGIMTSVVGFIEYFFIPAEWHVQLGVPRYFNEFLGLNYSGYLFGLPPNYWTRLGNGPLVRRAVSTYLSGQGFAVPFLIIMPIAMYNYVHRVTKYSLPILILCGTALLLTITRMTIVVCFIQSLLLLWLLGKKKLLSIVLVTSMMVFLLGLAGSSTLRTYVVETITLQDSSARVRPKQWQEGVEGLWENPFGLGLGSTGQTGSRFGLSGQGVEAGYFKLTGALGVPGIILFLGWFLGISIYALYVYHRFEGIWRDLAVLTFVIAVGFLLNNFTAPPDQSPFVIYVFGWLAGLTVQVATLRTRGNQSMKQINRLDGQQT